MEKIVLKGRKVCGGVAEGEALVTKEAIGFLGGVNPNTGVVVEKKHELEGQKITGRVLVFPHGKGSTSGPYVIHATARRGNGPVAMINVKAEPIIAVGAVMAGIPLMDNLERNPIEVISTGDWVRVDADNGIIEITKGKPKD